MALEIKQALDVIEQRNSELQLKKNTIATTLSNKGVSTQGTDSFDTMIANVGSIKTKLPILEGTLGVAEDVDGKRYGITQIDSKRAYHEMGETLEAVWEKEGEDWNINKITIDNKGYIYGVKSGFKDPDRLKKFDKFGNLIWEYLVPSTIHIILTDNERNVYVYCKSTVTFFDKCSVIKLDSNGNLLWDYELNKDAMEYIIAVDNECNVIIYSRISAKELITKIDANTNLVFEETLPNAMGRTPCLTIGKDNNIYIANRYLAKISSTGQVIYNHDLVTKLTLPSDSLATSICIGNDDYLYLGIRNQGIICRVEQRGTVIEMVQDNIAPVEAIEIDSDNFLYVYYNDYSVQGIGKLNSILEPIYAYEVTDLRVVKTNNEGHLYISIDYPNYKLAKYKDNYNVEKTVVLNELE
ncbi:hypothetical protein [Metaclostridioides mangenotii]|uniref:hypothetical protein n=1 Tax=Metaclostridioides mangenotii TaxID=1540 RepID=UPI0004849E63|nr:hypothetical protein [Clostridioides mangenotii]